MTTRQPTLATNPAFSQSEPDKAAQQGLIWAGWGRGEGETGWLSPPLRAQTFNILFILKCPDRSGCWLSDRLTGSGGKKNDSCWQRRGGRAPRSKTTCIFYWSNSVKSFIYNKGNNLEQSEWCVCDCSLSLCCSMKFEIAWGDNTLHGDLSDSEEETDGVEKVALAWVRGKWNPEPCRPNLILHATCDTAEKHWRRQSEWNHK